MSGRRLPWSKFLPHCTQSMPTQPWGEQLAGKIVLCICRAKLYLWAAGFHICSVCRTNTEHCLNAIFAQYPKAEIYEVEDYLKNIPKHYDPDHADFDFWGTQ
jgi:hypothetical protein